MGIFELPAFATGTFGVAKALAEATAHGAEHAPSIFDHRPNLRVVEDEIAAGQDEAENLFPNLFREKDSKGEKDQGEMRNSDQEPETSDDLERRITISMGSEGGHHRG